VDLHKRWVFAKLAVSEGAGCLSGPSYAIKQLSGGICYSMLYNIRRRVAGVGGSGTLGGFRAGLGDALEKCCCLTPHAEKWSYASLTQFREVSAVPAIATYLK
jgi:hypothetical protein